MPAPGVESAAAQSGAPGWKQITSSRIPQPWLRTNPTIRKGNEDSKTAPIRQTTVVIRKKLPWLDGPQQTMPGQFPDSKESLALRKTNDVPPPVPKKDSPSASHKPSVSSFNGDPALRAVGSTPSLRQRARSGDFKTLSVSSKPRPGITPVKSREHAKHALGVVSEPQQTAAYPSSEYSTTPVSERDEMPDTLPRRDPASYQRLIDKRKVRPEQRQPFVASQPGMQSQLDLPYDQPSPRDRKRGSVAAYQPQVSARETGRAYRAESCRSCDEAAYVEKPSRAITVPRKSVAVATAPPGPAAPSPTPPVRRQTLFAMPTHLMPSSSSSSSPPPRLSASDIASSSQELPLPPPPGRATTKSSPQMLQAQSRSLNRAVTGLENLMDEALSVARSAAERGQNDEVANILNSATYALRKASTVHGEMDHGRMSKPLRLSSSGSSRMSNSDESISPRSDRSSTHSASHSIETAPTMFTKSAQPSQQPIVVEQYKSGGQAPVSRHSSVESVHQPVPRVSPDRHSISQTPPRLYQAASADSIVRDFAYARAKTARAEAARQLSKSYGAATDYYGDSGQSVAAQPGVRPSISAPIIVDKPLPPLPEQPDPVKRWSIPPAGEMVPPNGQLQNIPVRLLEHAPTSTTIPPRRSSRSYEKLPDEDQPRRRPRQRHHRPHLSDLFESSYYHSHSGQQRGIGGPGKSEHARGNSVTTDNRYADNLTNGDSVSKYMRYSGPVPLLQRDISLKHPRRKHISLREGQGFSLGRYHRRQPIAREWSTHRKRIAAMIACLNTMFIGLIPGIYVSTSASFLIRC